MKQQAITKLVHEMTELVVTVKKQFDDNPAKADTILGYAIQKKVNKLYKKLKSYDNDNE